jgi:hypothetical protein
LLQRPFQEAYIQAVLKHMTAIMAPAISPVARKDMELVASDTRTPTRIQDALFYIFSVFAAYPDLVTILDTHLDPGHRNVLRSILPKAFTDLCSGTPTAIDCASSIPQAQGAWTAGMILTLEVCSSLEAIEGGSAGGGTARDKADRKANRSRVDIGIAACADGAARGVKERTTTLCDTLS